MSDRVCPDCGRPGTTESVWRQGQFTGISVFVHADLRKVFEALDACPTGTWFGCLCDDPDCPTHGADR